MLNAIFLEFFGVTMILIIQVVIISGVAFFVIKKAVKDALREFKKEENDQERNFP